MTVKMYAKPTISQLQKDDGRTEMYSGNTVFEAYREKKTPTIVGDPTKSATSKGMISDNIQSVFAAGQKKNNFTKISKYLNVHQEMNQVVEEILEKNQKSADLDQRKDFVISFLEQVDAFPSEWSLSVFENIKHRLPTFADTMLQYPKEFWKFFSDLITGLNMPHDSLSFKQSCLLVSDLAQTLVSKDQTSTWTLFEDFAYSKIIPLLQHQEDKRIGILQLLYSFCPKDSEIHFEVIKGLHERLKENEYFIPCLAKLITLEEEFSPKLLDTYSYYCTMGITSTNPKIRAQALSMLQVIGTISPETVVQMQEKIFPLLDDEWWDVTGQLLVNFSLLIDKIDTEQDEENYKNIFDFLVRVIQKIKTSHLKKIALSCLAPLLKSHDLASEYVGIMLSLQLDELRELFERPIDYSQDFQIGSSCTYKLISIPNNWHSVGVANALTEHVQEAKLENFELLHYEILHACLNMIVPASKQSSNNPSQQHSPHVVPDAPPKDQESTNSKSNNEDISAWSAIFKDNQHLFFVGLCDEALCQIAGQVIIKFFSVIQAEALKCIPDLIRILELVYKPRGEISKKCQEEIPNFLIGVYEVGGPFAPTMEKLAVRMKEQNMEHSPLVNFINYVEIQKQKQAAQQQI